MAGELLRRAKARCLCGPDQHRVARRRAGIHSRPLRDPGAGHRSRVARRVHAAATQPSPRPPCDRGLDRGGGRRDAARRRHSDRAVRQHRRRATRHGGDAGDHRHPSLHLRHHGFAEGGCRAPRRLQLRRAGVLRAGRLLRQRYSLHLLAALSRQRALPDHDARVVQRLSSGRRAPLQRQPLLGRRAAPPASTPSVP